MRRRDVKRRFRARKRRLKPRRSLTADVKSLRVRDGRCVCATVHGAPCRLSVIVEALGRPYALDVLVALDDRSARRYGELRRELDLAPNTLDRRLKELVTLGAVGHAEDGAYALTAEGARILSVVRSLVP